MLRNKINKGAFIVASALFGMLGFGSMAQATSTDDLQKQINSLRDQVEQDKNKLKINGFISAGVSGSDVAAQTRTTEISEKYGFTSDSVVGVQLDFTIREDTSATVQFLGRGTENFNAEIEWAYIKHQINDSYSIKAGRLRVPAFMNSEYLDIGMAYPWVRPAPDLYDVMFFTYYDGVSITHDFNIGSVDSSFQILTGNSDGTEINNEFSGLEMNFDIKLGISYVANVGNWTLNFNHLRMDAPIETTSLPAELVGLVTLLDQLGVEDASFENLEVEYSNLGITFDNGTWLVQAETLVTSSNIIFIDIDAYYASVARRFGKWMPYVMVSQMENRNNDEYKEIGEMIAMVPANPMLPDPVGTAAGFVAMTTEAQKSTYLGVGYDLMPNVKLKAEWRHIEVQDDTKGTFSAEQFSVDPFEKANVYSLVVDAVF